MKTLFAAYLLAGCAAGAKENEMVKIIGTVESCRVGDVSKAGGKKNLRTYLTIVVESTDPADAMGALKPAEELIGTEELHLEKGVRVEVTTHLGKPRIMRPLTLYTARAL